MNSRTAAPPRGFWILSSGFDASAEKKVPGNSQHIYNLPDEIENEKTTFITNRRTRTADGDH